MAYRVEFTPAATRQWRKLPHHALARLKPCIDALAKDPRPAGAEKLSGPEGFYRLRVGSYRLIYDIQDTALLVLMVKVGDRKDVYRH